MMEMADNSFDLNHRIARRIRDLRASLGLSLDALASQCGVSRSMISLIERGEASPTAVVLEKLATGLGVTLAALFDEPRSAASPVSRPADQVQWRDPASGYLRRNLSPVGFPSPMQLVEVDFPSGARVAYECGARDVTVHQQIWVLDGAIDITVGDAMHHLSAGDCLAMRLDQPTVFANTGRSAARYLVALCTEPTLPTWRNA